LIAACILILPRTSLLLGRVAAIDDQSLYYFAAGSAPPGIVAMLKMGRMPGAIYAGFVILALALNPPSVSLHGILTSQPVLLMQWLWRQGTGRAGNSAVS